MNGKKYLIPVILISSAVALCVTVYFFPLSIFEDSSKNTLVKDLILRSIISLLIVGVSLTSDFGKIFTAKRIENQAILPIIAAFAVALVNIPLYSLLSGKAEITDFAFLPVLAAYCAIVAFEEETLFRGIFYEVIANRVKDKKNSIYLRVVISAAVFSLFHLFNILGGSGGETLLQVVYTFLLGCLFATVKEASGNIYFGIASHAIFNFGGNIIAYAGKGDFFTVYLIVPTVIIGIAAGIICLFSLKKQNDLAKQDN